jgi:transketolase
MSSSAAPAAKRTRTAVPDTRCIDTIRVLSADIVEKANSGHPG